MTFQEFNEKGGFWGLLIVVLTLTTLSVWFGTWPAIPCALILVGLLLGRMSKRQSKYGKAYSWTSSSILFAASGYLFVRGNLDEWSPADPLAYQLLVLIPVTIIGLVFFSLFVFCIVMTLAALSAARNTQPTSGRDSQPATGFDPRQK